jgi:hypothetical protein
MVWTDPGSLSTASVARTHGGGNTPRPATTTLGITERNVLGIVTGLTAAGDAANESHRAGGKTGTGPVSRRGWLAACRRSALEPLGVIGGRSPGCRHGCRDDQLSAL